MKAQLLSCPLCNFSLCLTSQLQETIGPPNRPETEGSGEAPPPYRDKLLALHRSLVEIESITGNENDVGDFLADSLPPLHSPPPRQPLPSSSSGPQRFNVLAWPSREQHPSPRLLLTSHIDVVPPYIPYTIDDPP